MGKYLCTLFFNVESARTTLIESAMDVLGFSPSVMDVHFSDRDMVSTDLVYERSIVFNVVSDGSTYVLLMNEMFDLNSSQSFFWFQSKVDTWYKVLSLSWVNSGLNFLLGDELFSRLVSDKHFIYGFCCDSQDLFR